jgi:hypothetical protein
LPKPGLRSHLSTRKGEQTLFPAEISVTPGLQEGVHEGQGKSHLL